MKIYEPLARRTDSGEDPWAPLALEEIGEFRIEVTRTRERLVALVGDQATLDLLLRRAVAEPMAGQSGCTAPARAVLPWAARLQIAAALLVGLVVGMLVLPAIRYLSTGPSPIAAQMQEIDLPSEAASPRLGAKLPEPSPKLHAGTTKRIPQRKKLMIPVVPSAELAERAQPALALSPAPSPEEGQNSKRTALFRAFDTDEVQTWAEGGDVGFVLAGPLQQNGELRCRVMVQWKKGGEKGEASNVSLCKDEEGKFAR